MMGKDYQLKALPVVLIILVLGLSHLLSSEAVPLSRILLVASAQGSSMTEAEQQVIDQEAMMTMTEENFVHGRMEMEISRDDYESGPNKSHDPRTPAGRG
ncbi:hypothetical protein EJ110_NYTH17084 [Nymphaea thermarum]|nr:hypothetical protein EJ110_NYTH17084 [Nymphaea thermarum]